MRVLIVDDQPIVRLALEKLLSADGPKRLTVTTSDGEGTTAHVQADMPDIVLMDLARNTGDGLHLARTLNTMYPKLPILILSAHDEQLYAERAIRSGASGYIMKSASLEELHEALDQVRAGGIYVSEHMRQFILHKIKADDPEAGTRPMDGLSDRELEVFQLIGQGYNTHQIAEVLKLSVKTVETHRAHVKKKLQLPNNTILINSAAQWVLEEKLA